MGELVVTVGVSVTGQSRAGYHERVSGLAGRVHGNWVGVTDHTTYLRGSCDPAISGQICI